MCRIIEVSSISTIKVDSPLEILSDAPTRVKILSHIPSTASDAGTKQPVCASRTMSAVWRSRADFPAILGPVSIIICVPSLSISMSLGTYSSPGAIMVSMTG